MVLGAEGTTAMGWRWDMRAMGHESNGQSRCFPPLSLIQGTLHWEAALSPRHILASQGKLRG